MSSWSISLPGRVPTKKNHKRIVRTSTGRTFLVSSSAHDAWHDGAVLICRSKKPRPSLVGPLSLTIYFHLKGKLDADTDNLVASIQDLLTDAGIYADDRQIVELHAYKRAGFKDFETLVTVAAQSEPPA